MRTLILYDTLFGYSKEVAEILKDKLNEQNCYSLSEDYGDIKNYDVIYVGTYVRLGKIGDETQTFFKQHKAALLDKNVKLFIASLDKSDYYDALQYGIDPELFYRMKWVDVGARIQFKSMSFMDRRRLKKHYGITEDTDTTDLSKLDELIHL